jgi:hypothetical protein
VTALQSTPERRRRRALWWTLGVVGTVVLVAVFAVVLWLSNALNPPQEPPMQPDQVAALENDLRAKDSAEDTLSRYEQTLAQTAEQITALVPGLTWRWNRDSTTISCGGELNDTQGVQILTRHVLFDGPIPDSAWPAALDAVRNQASKIGADELFVYVDKPSDHDVAITGESGVEVRFGTKIAATLSARSDCHLRRADY